MRDEEGIIIRPTIPLVSQNAIPQWTMALWIATILMLGVVAFVAFSIPETIQRVNDAYQESGDV